MVGIEGFCSSGKTTLADQLAADLSVKVIHTDTFSDKFDSPPPYIECLRIDELSQAIHANRGGLVEGICLRDVLSACQAAADYFLYVRRVGANGLWYDELHFEEFEATLEGDDAEPHLSDMKYHSRVRPHERANVYFDRVERDG